MDVDKIGKSIAFLRKHYGMTQCDLAKRLEVTDKAVSRWERGQGTPDISLLTKLAIILDTDIESILEGNLTHLEIKWKGILNLNYFEGINAGTLIFNKRAVYFQLSFIMLAGIRDICIRGEEENIEYTKKHLGDGADLGINLEYELVSKDALSVEATIKSRIFSDYFNNNGIMLINGLDFLYGKDITKSFRRIIYDEKNTTRLTDFTGKPTSIYFFPNTVEVQKYRDNVNVNKMNTHFMERGVISFSIRKYDDLVDASLMLKILEKQQGEKIADLKEISVRRTFTSEEKTGRL